MKKYFLLVFGTFILFSCDPGGMSFVRNYSSDTLKVQLIGDYNKATVENENLYCRPFYENLYFKESIIPDKKLDDWYELMSKKSSTMIGDSIIEIVLPPESTIITNHGIAASRLFRFCASDYVIFKLGENCDTLFDIANYDYEDIIAFYKRNNIKFSRKTGMFSTVAITDIYEIK